MIRRGLGLVAFAIVGLTAAAPVVGAQSDQPAGPLGTTKITVDDQSTDLVATMVRADDEIAVAVPITDGAPLELGSEVRFRSQGSSFDCFVAASDDTAGVAALRCEGLDGEALGTRRGSVAPGEKLTVMTTSGGFRGASAGGYTPDGELIIDLEEPSVLPFGAAVVASQGDVVGVVRAYAADGRPLAAPGGDIASVTSKAAGYPDKPIMVALSTQWGWFIVAGVAGILVGFAWAITTRHPFLWRSLGMGILGAVLALVVLAVRVQSGVGPFLG